MLSSTSKGTLFGVLALLFWSGASGLIRGVSQTFGPIGGAALIYSLGTLVLLLIFGRPRFRRSSLTYLVGGSLLFATYEVCLSLALGFANSSEQAIQVGAVNSLWPCLTVLFAIVLNGEKFRWLIIPGTVLALVGMAWVVTLNGVSMTSFIANLQSNPLSYGMAAVCAVTFALYCNVTRRYARGENHIVLFFAITATVLWVKYALSSEQLTGVTWHHSLELMAAVISMAGGYALWNVGIMRGNLTFLATLSYFLPIVTSAFAATWLGASLTAQFWQGVLLVSVGSLVCWYATRHNT